MLVAAIVSGAVHGAASAADLCSGNVAEVALRARWTRTLDGDVFTYRAPSGQEMLTMAVYRMDERIKSVSQRADVLMKSVEFDRALEQKLGGGRVVLSKVKRSAADGVLQACYAGDDGSRHFVSLTLGAGPYLQHFYYEALGFTQGDFARSAQTLFGFGAPSTPVAALATPRPALRGPLLPGLLPARQ